MPYRGFRSKPPPVKMAWIVAGILALVAMAALVFGIGWGTYALLMLLFS